MHTVTARTEETAPWEALETGTTAWEDFSPAEQEAVVRHYAPKIRFLALRLKVKLPRSVELNEMISSGTLGLMEALGKFRPQLGIRFETYAETRIRGAMLDELRRLDWFPRSLRQRIRVLDEAMRKVEFEEGRQATEEELHEMTGLELRDVRQGLEGFAEPALAFAGRHPGHGFRRGGRKRRTAFFLHGASGDDRAHSPPSLTV